MSVAKAQEDISTGKAILALALSLLAVLLIPEVTNPGFYYADDVRHYFMPHIMDIGVRLNQGEIPWITLRSWFAGNYVGDGLLSIFNPINLTLYWICALIGDPAVAALFFAGSYLYLTGTGVYLLACSYFTPRRWAVIAALAYCSSAYVLYWHASSWWNAYVGTCWMIWAWWAWRQFVREQRWGVVAFFSTYFLLVSGWPQGTIMGALIVLVEMWFARTRFIRTTHTTHTWLRWWVLDMRNLAPVLLVAACAAGASLISNYPAYLHALDSARSSWEISRGPEWVGSFDYLIAAGWPSFLGTAATFFGNQPSLPVYYLAWFVPPALLLLVRRDIWLSYRTHVLPLLVIAAIAALISLGPAYFYMLRWPLRFLTFAHVPMVIAACVVIRELDLRHRRERQVWIAYAALGAVASTLADPQAWLIHLAFLGIAILALRLGAARDNSAPHLAVTLGLILLTIHLCFHLMWPANGNVGNWSVPSYAYIDAPESFSGDSRVVLTPTALPCTDGECRFASGNIGMWEPGRALNGYSPVGQRSYHATLGFNLWSWTDRKSAVTNYFAEDRSTGKSLYELMRISEFRVFGPVLLEQFEETKTGEWCTETMFAGKIFKRLSKGINLPGTVSWISPGIQVDTRGAATSTRESIELLANDTAEKGGRIVFARAWYPGYSAHLDGMPLKVERYADFLVSVLVPPKSSGTIELRYDPAGFSWTLPLAVSCTFLAIFVALLPTLRRRKS